MVEAASGRTQLVVYQLASGSYAGFRFLSGGGAETWSAFEHDDAVIVTEPYAAHRRLALGDAVRLMTDDGRRTFSIAGIYRDYSSDQGVVAMSRRTYERYFRDRALTGIGVYRRADVDAAQFAQAVRSVIEPLPNIATHSAEALRDEALRVFDRTFTITQVLRVVAALVAFIGITGSLMALQLEQRREQAVLRALGVTPRELGALIVAQTAAMGLLAGVLAIPVGMVMAGVLVHVINEQAFGWSMDLEIDGVLMLQGVGLALIAALPAGVWVASLAARFQPAAGLRQE